MIFSQIIDISMVAHGFFNILVGMAFLYQAWMGLTIRKARKRKEFQINAVKKHRRLGPFLVVLGLLGYLVGLILIFIDKGQVLEYPLHLTVGSLIVFFLITQYAISKKIKGLESLWRTPHFVIGLMILCLYLMQIVVGVGVLF